MIVVFLNKGYRVPGSQNPKPKTSTWEFPKIGDAHIAPEIVGSLLSGPQDKVSLVFGNSHISPWRPRDSSDLDAEHVSPEMMRSKGPESKGLAFRVEGWLRGNHRRYIVYGYIRIRLSVQKLWFYRVMSKYGLTTPFCSSFCISTDPLP